MSQQIAGETKSSGFQPNGSAAGPNGHVNTLICSNDEMAFVNGCALSRMLAKTPESAQAGLMTHYAENLLKLSDAFGAKISNVQTYLDYLRITGRSPCIEVFQKIPGSVMINVKVCFVARTAHKTLNNLEYSGDICPIALMFMVAKARELGWTPEKNLFDYIKFSGKFSYFTEIGSKTVFEVVKKE